MNFVVRLFACFCLALTVVNADPPKSESDLRHVLFASYDKLVRPVKSTTDVVPVRIGLYPVAIKDVDVDDREVKLHSWLYMKWQDQFLTWNPSEYSGLAHLRLPSSEVWIPDIGLYYGASDSTMFPTVRTNVVLYSNGTVLWVPPFTFKAHCPPTENQVTEDTFQCTVSFGSWTYDVTLLDLHEKTANVLEDLTDHAILHHKKWILEAANALTEQKHYSCCEEAYPVVHYNLLFRKRSAGED